MIPVGENLVISTGYRVSRADLRIGKTAAKGDHAADSPGQEEKGRSARTGRRIHRRTKNAHADDQGDDDHHEIEKVQLFLIHRGAGNAPVEDNDYSVLPLIHSF